jgi:hypothetical protein
MKERGELAEHVGRNGLQPGTHSLEELGLRKNQSSRYQLEARVLFVDAKLGQGWGTVGSLL